ncbi:MAG: hypothetical protein JSS95_15130 [Acidobacteria bacterium]|nr:hypothetical protein [Acidobacteriota bacterium]
MRARRALRFCLLGALCFAAATNARASGPRWVTGAPYFYPPGYPIAWYTDSPQYFTDAGDLSPYVNHAAADAIVQAAAGVWNVQTSRLTLTYGGTLSEHVSSSNTYPSTTGIVFPLDVQASNYLAKQIAVIYDSDGSVTDMLLGAGASSPSGCRQNAVTESVDSFRSSGYIQHAVLVLNGRCTGPAPEQQLQIRYQLMRAFGRVLGLGWSQTNDNVFTGSPRPTYQQALYWPVMHPIDVICGPYTYQCMPNPFTLRDDDISGLGLLYPAGWTVPPGKTTTLARATQVRGTITFPNGQGMQGVNVVVHRLEAFWSYPEDWESVSGVTGYLFRRNNANPVSLHLPASPAGGMGSVDPSLEGVFNIARVPLYDWEGWQNLVISTQPINPLYIGAYAVGPYEANAVLPSGSTNTQTGYVMGPLGVYQYTNAIGDAAGPCNTSADGTELSPAPAPATGWWAGNLCSYGHSAWTQFTVKPKRSFTVEVTAEDELGQTTASKALPVIGLWNSSDAVGVQPSIAAAATAFNSSINGMTTLSAQPGAGTPSSLRMAIADQRGDGRPDYAYRARILYADSIAPANVPSFGGAVTITGMGFRPGNTVLINGVAATVTGWTANTITAVVPSLNASTAVSADVTVCDLVSGATTTMTGALNYAAPQPALVLLSSPSGPAITGSPASVPLAVQLLQGDGVTPIAGAVVNLSLVTGQARFDTCGAGSCTLLTDAQGKISTTVTPLVAGVVTFLASSGAGGTVSSSFTALTRAQSLIALNADLYVAAGGHVDWPLQALAADNGAPVAGVPVQWSANTGGIVLSTVSAVVDADGLAQTVAGVGPLGATATASITACAWSSVCAGFSAHGVAPDQWGLQVVSGSGQSVAAGNALAPIVFRVVDPVGHPVAGAPVDIHQTLEPWFDPCSNTGRCPVAPVYGRSSTTLISAIDGTVTVIPLDVAGQPVVSNIVAASGTQGFASLAVERLP